MCLPVLDRAQRLSALLLLLAVSLPWLALAQLPAPLERWLSLEQEHLSRTVDTTRLMGAANLQDPAYAPETRAIFPVKSYWVSKKDMHTFEGMGLTPELRSLFTRTDAKGTEQVRLLVHPESAALYADLLRTATPAETFLASATASSRTLLVWPKDAPERAFFGKLSLDKSIGNVRRTISQGEVARSIGVNDTLHMARARGELPESFKFVPEVFSTIARGMEEGGMVIRAIPEEVRRGDVTYVPLFALYAPAPDGKPPILVDMIRRSGQDARTFVRDRIIAPFARQWFEVAIERGIFPEPHAQNVLLEVGKDGLPTGRFVHRDFGGFNLDFPHRERLGLALPSPMPRINSVERDYKVRLEGRDMVARNLDSFFYGGFVFNLDRELPRFQEAGLLGGPAIEPDTFKRELARAIEREYEARLGTPIHIRDDLKAVRGMVAPIRAERTPGLRRGLYRARRNLGALVRPRVTRPPSPPRTPAPRGPRHR